MSRELVHILTWGGYTPVLGMISAPVADILPLAESPETFHLTNNVTP